MPSPIPKTNEISQELTSRLDSGVTLQPMEFRRFVREIEKIKDCREHDYLMALVNAANGAHDVALEWFQKALKHKEPIIAENYLVYLIKSHRHLEYVRESLSLAREYPGSIDINDKAFEGRLLLCDINGIEETSKKLISMLPREESEVIMENASLAINRSRNFVANAGMEDSDLVALNELLLKISGQANASPTNLDFFSMTEEGTNSIICSVDTNDADLLSEMNFNLAMSIADSDRFVGKKFSSWFRGSREQNDNK
ncbi:hypothetical protein PGS49_21040 [Yersinia intermedia]|uniref:hypothetical protein n=1 Tax=Yersinia intermedia TaxID=631 RepID=UPI0022FF0DA7|nr:hypothetical protein [Yersinia intermedia]MDA5483108.1 hypothetical protein [Yersinia intermedia]